MPPAPKHHPMNPMAHLRNAVSAHRAVQEGIATHAEKEHAKREAHAAKLNADANLSRTVPSPRVPLHAYRSE